MESIKLHLPVILALFLVFSCSSTPKTETPNVTEKDDIIEAVETQETEETFDPGNISQEYYVSTRENVRHFIENLNTIISNKNYNAWKDVLSPEYFEEISSPENLQQVSESPALKARKIVLKSPQDYFTHVVVPSRANSRVDDIEFISRDRVKAFTINTNRAGDEQRLLLYNLEKTGDLWKIIN